MEITYRKMTRADFDDVLDMMRTFYTSPAVATDGSEEIYRADIEACLDPESPLTGYVFAEAETCVGYAMTYPGFATEYGRPCVWIEDLYLTSETRGRGVGRRFLTELAAANPNALLRLEAEEENSPAVHLYRSVGFTEVPYLELWKL